MNFKSRRFWIAFLISGVFAGCRQRNNAAHLTIENQSIGIPAVAFGCTWQPAYLGWVCQVISIDDRGHLSGSDDLHIFFSVPGESARTVNDLVNRSFNGTGSLAHHSGYSWTLNPELEVHILAFDPKSRLVRGQFKGPIVRLTWRHPKGRLVTVNDGTFEGRLLWDNQPDGLPIQRRELDPYKNLDDLRRLSTAGDLKAKFLLGLVYSTGRAVTGDDRLAFRLWQEAAEAGYPEAQSAYSLKFADDPVTAYMWNYLAAKRGYEKARGNCRQLGSTMSQHQRNEAIRRADAWTAKWNSEPLTPTKTQERDR